VRGRNEGPDYGTSDPQLWVYEGQRCAMPIKLPTFLLRLVSKRNGSAGVRAVRSNFATVQKTNATMNTVRTHPQSHSIVMGITPRARAHDLFETPVVLHRASSTALQVDPMWTETICVRLGELDGPRQTGNATAHPPPLEMAKLTPRHDFRTCFDIRDEYPSAAI
jgi:hypothetical protein